MINITIQARRTIKGVRIKLRTGEVITGKYYLYARINGKVSKVGEGGHLSIASAKEEVHELQQENKEGRFNIANNKITLADLREDYKAHIRDVKNLAVRTKAIYDLAMQKLCEFQLANPLVPDRVSKFKRIHALQFRNYLLQKYKASGASINLRAIHSCFEWAVDEKECPLRNPFKGIMDDIKVPRTYRFLSDKEIQNLYDSAAMARKSDILEIVRLVIHTGLRISEVINFDKTWIMKNNFILIPDKERDIDNLEDAFETKDRDPRVIPVDDAILSIISRVEEGRVFPGWNKDRLESAFDYVVLRMKREFGFKGRFRFHDMRHTFASLFLRGGGSLEKLQVILGHSSIKTTQIYRHYVTKDLEIERNRVKYSAVVPVHGKPAADLKVV